MIVTDCTDCPCLSECHDESYCNLDYDCILQWTDTKRAVLSYISRDCKLKKIITTSSRIVPFSPAKIEIRWGIRPVYSKNKGYYWAEPKDKEE